MRVKRFTKAQVRADMERGLSYIAVCAFEEVVSGGTETALHTLLDAGMKVWDCSGSDADASLQGAYAAKLAQPHESVPRPFLVKLHCILVKFRKNPWYLGPMGTHRGEISRVFR